MTDSSPTIDPNRAALLVMDYQNGIVAMVDEPEGLLSRAADAISLVRARGGQIGYVRVAFEDADYEGFPATSTMGARVASAGKAFHADSPHRHSRGRGTQARRHHRPQDPCRRVLDHRP